MSGAKPAPDIPDISIFGLVLPVGGVRDNGSVQGYRDDAVVLRTQKLGEADRIITLLTRHNGRVRAVARGIRRTKSRFGARLEPFTHVDVMVHPARSLDVITQAEVIRAYGTPLVTDYPRYTAGTAMLEAAERFTPVEKEPAIRQFLLLIGGLRTLGEATGTGGTPKPDDTAAPDEDEAAGPAETAEFHDTAGTGGAAGSEEPRPETRPESTAEAPSETRPEDGAGVQPESGAVPRDPRLVLDAYFLRSLTFAGYAPALAECARCGATDKLVAFAVAAGGMACADCRPPGAAAPAPQTVALMIALLHGDWNGALRSERRHRVECSGLVAAYLQWHLEHSIRSLRHVERA
jgi:recombinational DNA repair protein (RecF pathway)